MQLQLYKTYRLDLEWLKHSGLLENTNNDGYADMHGDLEGDSFLGETNQQFVPSSLLMCSRAIVACMTTIFIWCCRGSVRFCGVLPVISRGQQ